MDACEGTPVPSGCSRTLWEISESCARCVSAFTEEHKTEFSELLSAISEFYTASSESQMRDVLCSPFFVQLSHKIILLFQETVQTPYFTLFSYKIYSVCLRLLLSTSVFPFNLKIDLFQLIVRLFPLDQVLDYFIERYSLIDGSYFKSSKYGRVSFKNHCLIELYEQFVMKKEDLLIFLLRLRSIIPFSEFLIKKKSPLVLLYSYYWVKEYECGKNHDTFLIRKIFTKFVDIRRYVLVENRDTKWLHVSRKGTALVFKKLFFYFLQNRSVTENVPVLANAKLLKLFGPDELKFIYKRLKGKSALINVFRQLDQSFLLKELRRNVEDTKIFEAISPNKLTERELYFYYRTYFKIIANGYNRKETGILWTVGVEIHSLDAFSQAFNEEVDKSFVKNIRIKQQCATVPMSHIVSLEIAQMLVYYTDVHHYCFMDPVYIASGLWDYSSNEHSKNKIVLVNNILWILYNIFDQLSYGLKKRLFPILQKMITAKGFVFRAGMLLSKYPFPILTLFPSVNIIKSINTLELLAALNHPDFDVEYAQYKTASTAVCNLLPSVYKAYHLIHSNESISDHNISYDLLEALKQGSQPAILILRLFEIADTERVVELASLLDLSSKSLHFLYQLMDGDMRQLVAGLFLKLLRCRMVLPATVVPWIMSVSDSSYLKRHHLETVINSTEQALLLMAERIRKAISAVISKDEQETEYIDDRISSIIQEYYVYLEHINEKNINKIMKGMEYEDILLVFLFLKEIRVLPKSTKRVVYRDIEEKTGNDSVQRMLNNVMIFYDKKNRGKLPVAVLLENLV